MASPCGSSSTDGKPQIQEGFSQDVLYGPRSSIEERFPDTKGSIRWAVIMKNYIDRRGETIHFFSKNGKKLLGRHATNQRRQDSVVRKYAKGVLQHGILSDMRSQPMAVPGEQPDHFELIGAATLIEAAYIAMEVQEDNVFCKQLRENGVSNVIIFKNNTPADVLEWVAAEHNRFHHGSSGTLIEQYREAGKIVQAWMVHRKEHNISVASCPSTGEFRYERLYANFVQKNFPHAFSNWDSFDHAKAFFKDVGANPKV